MRPLALALAGIAAWVVGGCSTAEYYWQGISGQLDLLGRAQPMAEVLEATPDPLVKRKLERVLAIREYASRELGLPDNASYRRYTDLGRRFVLWNVFATPELSLTPRQWCFPIAGCVNYRGYFAEADARAEAARLAVNGNDTYIGGVPAYSTLGYFADPMPSTFLRYPDTEIARLIFHELAHQVAYAPDDTVFNESFAVAVEEEGVHRWLAEQHDPDLDRQYATSRRHRDGFRTLVEHARAELVGLYTSEAKDADKRAAKAAVLENLRSEYASLKREWGGFGAYDYWFAQGPNNASLAAVGLYAQKVPQFQALLASEGGDLARLYARVKTLAGMPKAERDTALAAAGAAPLSLYAPR
ncbi:MAG TPA: aminopeptidase [Casimicrobiaceae bacterium]|nr:aminopeptidase [Casimicrobiaceae bacterium]